MIEAKPDYEQLERSVVQLSTKLDQRTQELSVISAVQEALAKKMDMQSIYTLVGNRIRDTFNAQAVIIATFDHENGTEHFGYAFEKGELFDLKPRPFDKLRQNLIDTKQRILINEKFEEAYRQFGLRVLPGSEFPKSALFVPLIIDEKVTGYVSLQNVDVENAFTESDARLLETLAHSMSSALENARLLRETEQRTAELAVINSVQEALAKEMDIQAIYDLVGNRIRELFDAQAVGIATFDHKHETEHIHYLIEKGERYYPAPRPLNILRKHLIASREKILINKNFEEVAATFGMKQVPGTAQPKSAIYVPLMVGEKVTGNISLQNIDRENAISESDVRLLETLANSMSVALENARLFDETNRLLKETEQQKAELGVINSVQEGLAKELDMQAIYDLVGNRIRELFRAQAVIIATFDHDTATEHFKYLIEDGQRFYLPPRPYDKLRQHLIVTRQKIVINSNYEEAYARFGLRTLPGTNMTKSGVFVPLVIGDKVNSYISLQNNEIENAFSESDVRLLETLANSMSVALENARLFDETTRLLKETEQRTAELAVINSVQEGLGRELEMKAIYELVGNKIREVFDAQVVIIATFDHETGTEKFNYMIEKGEKFHPEPRRYDKLRYELITNKQKILINNNAEQALVDFGLKVIAGSEMPKSLLYVPLIVGNKVTSYVSLQNLDKENAFSDADVRLLETLANSMSVALENARLFDETNRLLKETEQGKAELAVINSVQEGLARELDINGIYKLVGDRIQKLFNAQAVIIASFDHERKLECFNYHVEKEEISFPAPRPYDKVRKHLIETGQNILINENSDEAIAEFGLRVVPGTEMPKSMLFMPLKVGDKVTGYVSLQNIDQENAFSYSDVRLLSTLANSMSVALENARLFDETNRLLKETEQRTAELAVINSVQEGLAKELNIQGIYELVGEKIREIFQAQVIDIATYDPDKNLLEDKYSFEKGDRSLLGSWEPYGFRKHIIETKEVLVINQDLQQKSVEFNSKVLMGEQPLSCVFVPLISGSELKGMISLQDLDKENAFSEADVRLLRTLANSMTVALENARLFDKTNRLLKETEQRNAELAVINSVQESLVAQMDIEAIYELVGEKMREIFDPQVIDIVTYDNKANLIEDKYAYEKGDRTLVGPRQPNGFRKHVIETGQILLHNSGVEKAMREFGNEILFGDVPKSQIYVPMIAAGKVTGIISLQNIDHENAFSESDVSLLTTLANSMSVALESARLFDETNRLLKETEQRNAELAVINSVQESLVAQIDMNAIYELVGEKMREIFNPQVIDIVTYDATGNVIEDKYSYEKGDRTLVGRREARGFRKHVIETGELLLHNSNVEQAMKDYGNEVLIGEMPKSQIYVPMIAGGKVTGVISLQNIDHENAFSDSDVSLLTTLANSMSVALESARLFDETNRLLEETEQRTAELTIINSVQEGLASKLDMQAIYDLVGDKVQAIFDAQVVDIVTYDSNTELIYPRYVIERGERFYEEPRPLVGFRKHVVETRQPLLINDDMTSASARYGNPLVVMGETSKAVLFVPMIVGAEVKGIISLQNLDHENAFSDSDVRLLQTLANSMSVALENARLFDETTRLLKETEQRTAELAIINSVQEGLAKELDIQGIYELVGEKMRAIFKAQIFDIVTYDKSTQLIEDRYAYEKGDRTLLGPRPLKGFRKHVIDTRKPLVINRDLEGERTKYDQAVIIGQAAKSLAMVPLFASGEVTGAISLQNLDEEYAFPESDVNLLTTLANSMSVALENARLFDETTRLLKETEQRTAELAVINSVQEGLAKELDIQAIYTMVGERIRNLFDAQVVAIATFNHEEHTEKFEYMVEKGQRYYAKPRPLGKLRLHLIQSKKKIVINKQEEGYAWFGNEVIPGTELIKSAVFVPLMIGDKITSYVTLQNIDRENAFTEAHIRLLETLANSMSVALENARLFDETNRLLKETEQRTAELKIINSVQEGLASKLDIQAIYDLVGDKIRDVFDTQGISISYYDRERNYITNPYYLFKGQRIYEQGFELGKGLTSHIIQTGQPLLINENAVRRYKELGAVFAQGETDDAAKSWLGVPLVSGGKVNGTIRLENYEKEFAYSESDVSLLQTLANSMSVALENARLFDETNRLLKETEQRTAELAVINSVQEGLAHELDMQGIYNLVGDRVKNLFQTHSVIIASFDLERRMEHFNYLFEHGEIYKVDPRPINKLRETIIEKKQTIYIETEEKARNQYGIVAIGETKMPKSLMFVPLLSGNNVKGYVSIQNVDRERAFNESDIRLLETLANSMSVALENARLFDETNRLLKETEQRTGELAVINSVQEGLVREMDMKAIYEIVGDRLCNLFNIQTVVIRTFDHETGLEHWQYAKEKGERQTVPSRPFNWNSTVLIQTKKPLDIRENYVEVSKKHGGTGVTAGHPPKSAVFVPMIVGDVVKGSVSLQNVDIEHAFSDSDIRLLTTLTNSMSVALENARLFDETNRLLKETEQRTEELGVINNVQEGLVREMNVQAIYQLVGNRIGELFDTQTIVIRTFDHQTGLEHFHYAIEKGVHLERPPQPLIWANKLLIETRQPLFINRNYAETARKHGGTGVGKGLPPKSAVFVPMIVGDVVRGSVTLQNVDTEDAFSESDMRLLTTLTNSMSVALENARLFDETSHLLAEAKQRANELATVNNISKALASQLDPDELIQFVGDQMKNLFKANIVYLALLNKKTQFINFPYVYGESLEPMKLGEGLTSKIILTGEPLLLNQDVQGKGEQLGVQVVGLPAASYLGVPIPVGDEIIGVLSVQSTEHENRFNESDQRLLSTIAASVGVALNNATLFEDVKQAKMEAEAATKAAEKANDAKSAFLSTVSHELRTPLTSVLGFAKIIRKRLDEKIFPVVEKSPKTQKTISQISENLNVVVSEGERLTHLINDVLDLAKIEAGKMEWNMEEVALAEVAERAIAATAALFDNKNLELEKNIQADIPAITGDRDKLIQVMVNLISNSVKFTPKGKVSCKVSRKKNEIVVSVSDTGIGIAPDDHAAVFEQFKQVGDTLTDKPKGTGLGLPICKEIIEHHGGRIWVESQLGKGSTFSFALPVTKTGAPKPIHIDDLIKRLKEQVSHSQLGSKGNAARLLIVDDDDSIRSLLEQELGEAGYLIDEASNGKEALAKVRANKPDLIILDVMMPEMNGFDVAAVLKNDPQTMDIPIIVLSIVQDKARGFRIGVDRYLTKPIDTGLLFNEIGSLLEQGKSKKKVMIVDENSGTINTLTEVLKTRGYAVTESNGKELFEKAVASQPDIIIMNSILSGKQDIVQTLRFEKGLENVLFLVYQ